LRELSLDCAAPAGRTAAEPRKRFWVGAAKLLGLYASYYRFIPALYIALAFFVIPWNILGVSIELSANPPIGITLLVAELLAVGVFEFWWLIGIPMGQPGCFRVLSKELRKQREEELIAANAALAAGPASSTGKIKQQNEDAPNDEMSAPKDEMPDRPVFVTITV